MSQSKKKLDIDQFPCQNDGASTAKNAPTAPKTAPKRRKILKKNAKTMPPGPPPRPGSPEFKRIQDFWYKKAKESGFKDIERPHPVTGDQSESWLNGKSLRDIADSYNPETLAYYRRLSCYLAHNRNWSKDRFERFASRLYAQGLSYGYIVEQARKRLIKANANKWHVHQTVKRFEALALAWNKTSPKGLDWSPDIGE